jgi:hypothetical protein
MARLLRLNSRLYNEMDDVTYIEGTEVWKILSLALLPKAFIPKAWMALLICSSHIIRRDKYIDIQHHSITEIPKSFRQSFSTYPPE